MTSFHVIAGAGDRIVQPTVRKITLSDLTDALRAGLDDFRTKPSHVVFLSLIYPIAGVVLAAWTSGTNVLHLLFPLMSGFALLGPFAAIGLYEISRRREAGLDTSWSHAFDVLRSPAIPAIAALGFFLMVVFVAWILAAQAVYTTLFGPDAPSDLWPFLGDVLSTPRGWTLILVGNLVGLVFATVVLCTTVVAFPILLDRDVGAYEAMRTSLLAVAANPVTLAVWGIIVALCLALGSLPLFAGLALVFPVLGHATWHLYRKLVTRPRE